MTTFPATLVCTGCGSWLKIDVKRTGSMVAFALCAVTLGMAYFVPYLLMLIPVYFVLSMGPLQSYSVEMVRERQSDLWTISRRTGSLRQMNPREAEAHRDLQLSNKLAGATPFRKPRRKNDQFADYVPRGLEAGRPVPDYDLSELPTGLPN